MSSMFKRPGRITFLAIAMIVLGCLAVVNNGFELPGLVSAANSDPPAQIAKLKPMQMPNLDAVHHAMAKESPAYFPVQFAYLVGRIVVGIAMFACGFLVMKMKPSARTFGLIIIPVAMAVSLGHNIYDAFLLPAKARAIGEMMQPEQGPPVPLEFFDTVFGILFGILIVVSLIFNFVISLVLFFMLLSSKTKAAFDPAASMPLPDDEPGRGKPKRSRYEGYDDEYPTSSSSQTGITDIS